MYLCAQVYFGTQHSRVYILANLMGENCANGMSWLVKKDALEKEGGLRAFSEYLAEDFFIGKALWERYCTIPVCVCVCVYMCAHVQSVEAMSSYFLQRVEVCHEHITSQTEPSCQILLLVPIPNCQVHVTFCNLLSF